MGVMVSTFFGLRFSDAAEDRLLQDYHIWNRNGRRDTNYYLNSVLVQVQARLADDGLRAQPYVDVDARQRGGTYLWMKKDPELFNLRMILHRSNMQQEEMRCLIPPMNPVYNIVDEESVNDAAFRAKFSGKVHFIVPADDCAV